VLWLLLVPLLGPLLAWVVRPRPPAVLCHPVRVRRGLWASVPVSCLACVRRVSGPPRRVRGRYGWVVLPRWW
jgi:hypothetical protein